MALQTIVQARIPFEIDCKLRKLSSFPRREWGKRNYSDFYGSLILKYLESTEFKAIERDEEIRRLKSEVSNRDFLMKMKDQQIERLKKENEALKAPPEKEDAA